MAHDHHTHRGHATEEGTSRFAARVAGVAPDFFGIAAGLRVSSIGIGTYLGRADDATDESYVEAIRRAVLLGVNHVDTAGNYRHQRSERNVGEALERLLHAKECKRDEVFVATKAGYVPFDAAPPADPKGFIVAEVVGKGLARADELVAGCHCMTPAYLRAMVRQSLANMRLDTVDVLYLHNPEQQLAEVDRATFLARMRAAFATLEEEVAAGRIRAYGTATWNGYRVPAAVPGHLELEELVAAAREVGGADHHFRYVQLPYNLAMTEVARAATQHVGGRAVPLLQAAADLGVFVSASGSLAQGKLLTAVGGDVAAALPGLATDGQRALQFVRSTPGVMTALTGMSRVEHVDENLGLRGVPRAPAAAIAALRAE